MNSRVYKRRRGREDAGNARKMSFRTLVKGEKVGCD